MASATYDKPRLAPRSSAILAQASSGGVYGRLLSAASGTSPQTLLVTSPQAGDGKSISSLALAAALVESGKEVLWIDAHAADPAGPRYFEGLSGPGTTEWLNGSCKVKDLPHLEAPAGLHICTQSEVRPEAELQQADWTGRLAEATSVYDVVIVDGGDLNSSSIPVMLAPLVQGVVLVAACRKTQTQQLSDAQHRLEQVNAKVLGVILNRRKRTLPPWVQDEA